MAVEQEYLFVTSDLKVSRICLTWKVISCILYGTAASVVKECSTGMLRIQFEVNCLAKDSPKFCLMFFANDKTRFLPLGQEFWSLNRIGTRFLGMAQSCRFSEKGYSSIFCSLALSHTLRN